MSSDQTPIRLWQLGSHHRNVEMDRLRQDYDSDSDESERSRRIVPDPPDRVESNITRNQTRVRILTSFPESSDEKMELGFQRSLPHIEGNWSGHIYLPLSILEEETDEIEPNTQSWEEQFNQSSFQAFLPLASQTVDHFVAKTRTAQLDDTCSNADIVVIPHFKYAHHDDDDDDDDNNSNYQHIGNNCSHPENRHEAKKHKKNYHHTLNKKQYQQYTCNLHITLSKPFYLQQHNIQSFINDLTQHIQSWQQTQSSPLLLSFQPTHHSFLHSILFNEEQTRAFLTLSTMEDSSIQVISFIRKVIDPVMTKYGFPTYRFDGKIQNPDSIDSNEDRGQVNIHVTIASILGRRSISYLKQIMDNEVLLNHCKNQHQLCTMQTNEEEKGSTLNFIPRHVVCVLGNHHKFIIPFSKG